MRGGLLPHDSAIYGPGSSRATEANPGFTGKHRKKARQVSQLYRIARRNYQQAGTLPWVVPNATDTPGAASSASGWLSSTVTLDFDPPKLHSKWTLSKLGIGVEFMGNTGWGAATIYTVTGDYTVLLNNNVLLGQLGTDLKPSIRGNTGGTKQDLIDLNDVELTSGDQISVRIRILADSNTLGQINLSATLLGSQEVSPPRPRFAIR